jgi:hypothetical protein
MIKLITKAPPRASLDQIATIWTIIEAKLELPAIIAVASATAIDDTETIARGLSHAAHDAGLNTAHINMGRANTIGDLEPYANLSLAGSAWRRDKFDSALSEWKMTFDVIIFEVPQLLTCPLGSHVARLSNGIVLALHPNRKVTPADRELKALTIQLGASILGVVKTVAAPQPVAVGQVQQRRSLGALFRPIRQQ